MPKKTGPLKDKSSDEKLLSPGEILKKERLLQKKSLHSIATQLCINERYLGSIEGMRLSELPERVYTLGFINTYAIYLGLNPTPLLAQYGDHLGAPPVHHSPICHEIAPKIRPKWYHFLVALGALLVAFFLWEMFSIAPSLPSTDSKETVSVPVSPRLAHTEVPHTSAMTPIEAPLEEQTPPTSPCLEDDSVPTWAPEAPPTPQKADTDEPFILKATEKVWIEIRDGNKKVVYTKTLVPGEEYTYLPTLGSTLSTGNAGGLEIRRGKDVFKPLGATGEVKRNIPLAVGSQEAKTEGLILSLE